MVIIVFTAFFVMVYSLLTSFMYLWTLYLHISSVHHQYNAYLLIYLHGLRGRISYSYNLEWIYDAYSFPVLYAGIVEQYSNFTNNQTTEIIIFQKRKIQQQRRRWRMRTDFDWWLHPVRTRPATSWSTNCRSVHDQKRPGVPTAGWPSRCCGRRTSGGGCCLNRAVCGCAHPLLSEGGGRCSGLYGGGGSTNGYCCSAACGVRDAVCRQGCGRSGGAVE